MELTDLPLWLKAMAGLMGLCFYVLFWAIFSGEMTSLGVFKNDDRPD